MYVYTLYVYTYVSLSLFLSLSIYIYIYMYIYIARGFVPEARSTWSDYLATGRVAVQYDNMYVYIASHNRQPKGNQKVPRGSTMLRQDGTGRDGTRRDNIICDVILYDTMITIITLIMNEYAYMCVYIYIYMYR